MSDNAHDLAHEFPEHKDRIHELKVSNNHFRSLFDKYHDLNKKIHRAELRIEILTEDEEELLKKERLALKDSLYAILQGKE
jgi:uncharacterized protein YdcH (DUF465 family)